MVTACSAQKDGDTLKMEGFQGINIQISGRVQRWKFDIGFDERVLMRRQV